MVGNFKLNIDKKVTEQFLIENCIMWKLAGVEYRPIFFLYALGKGWNFNKLMYYADLLEEII
jgi:hypothetical protein